jgi:RimJ/RimL family protein N-acetyltransferase
MIVIETQRLRLRHFCADDAAFVIKLLNDPGWLRFIGDRGVRTLDDARKYIISGPVAMYARCGFGLYLVERASDVAPVGMCGLIKRDSLDDVDIGFAFLPEFSGKGYAREAADAVMAYGKKSIGLKRIVGITSHDNQRSILLLEKIGLKFERPIKLPKDEEEISLFAWDA